MAINPYPAPTPNPKRPKKPIKVNKEDASGRMAQRGLSSSETKKRKLPKLMGPAKRKKPVKPKLMGPVKPVEPKKAISKATRGVVPKPRKAKRGF